MVASYSYAVMSSHIEQLAYSIQYSKYNMYSIRAVGKLVAI